jgi:hypothetical protein
MKIASIFLIGPVQFATMSSRFPGYRRRFSGAFWKRQGAVAEGFGLPLVEANAAVVQIIGSDIPFFH